VARVYYNYEVELVEPVEIKRHIGGAVTSVEIGVEAVKAPQVWAMGATGSGVLVGNMDSGVDGSHLPLAVEEPVR
jgi:subtilisin family serine protease